VRSKIGVLALVIVSAGAGLSVRALAAAQATRATDQDVLPALLIEVRGLRAAMEHMASAGPRVQLALGRLQLQEQRVNNLLRRMESVQNDLAGAVQEAEKARLEVTRTEGALRSVNLPPAEREHVDDILPVFRANAVQATAKVQRLLSEESGLTQELAVEQNRWTDINRQMEELERTLTRK
jgi:hypothetical protein